MTPDEAREHLAWPEGKDHPKVRDGSGQTWFEVQAGESHPYWNRLPDAPYEDAVMYAVAHDALATIAGMRPEYRAEYQAAGGWWFPVPNRCSCGSGWGAKQRAERLAAAWQDDGYAMRIVRHYVTDEEEA